MDRPVSKHLDDEGATLSPYIYQSLKSSTEIRVISLLPAPSLESKLEVYLTHIDRNELFPRKSWPPPYEAMSYSWGEPTFSHILQCKRERFERNADEKSKALPITENVDQMLRYLRKPRKIRYLWIDAICLDQSSNDEKAQQVALMDRIYAQAKKVHIWLGTSTDGSSKKIFSVLQGLRKNREFEVNLGIMTRTFGSEYPLMLDAFFSRSWFKRRWVIQEAAFAQRLTLRCDSNKIEWTEFASGVLGLEVWSWEGYRSKIISNVAGIVSSILSIRRHRPRPYWLRPTLLDLIWDFSEADCQRPEDRLFALYNLEMKDTFLPKIDYAKPWRKIYASVAHRYYTSEMEIRGSIGTSPSDTMLRHLASFGSLAWRCPGIPSWIPDWSTRRADEPPIDHILDAERHCTSDLNGKRPCEIEGTVDFTVSWIGTLQRLDETPFECSSAAPDTNLAILEREFEHLARLLAIVLLEDHVQARLQLSLCMDEETLLNHIRRVYTARLRERFPRFSVYRGERDLIQDEALNSTESALSKLSRFCKTFTSSAITSTDGPCLISGIGPRNMAVGDRILPHFGLKVIPNESGLWTLIGHVLRRSQPISASSSHVTEHRYESVGICFLSWRPWKSYPSRIGTGGLRITLV